MATTPEYREKKLELDDDGYLLNIDTWNIGVAEQLAAREDIQLAVEHWKLITAIRLHYERTGSSPRCRDILKETGFTKQDMYRLFPSGHIRGAYKVAGLPKPAGCN